MNSKLLFILTIVILIIAFSFIVSEKDSGRNENAEIENCDITFLSPSDFMPEKDIFNQSLFPVYTITKLNREIYDVSSADFNKDGFMDLVVTGSCNVSKIYILYYQGNWNFTYEHIFSFENDISGLVTGDFDNDGDMDIIFTSGENTYVNNTPFRINGTVNILKNEGDMNFTRILIFKRTTGEIRDDEGRINPRITSADYDNDGDLDLLVGDNSGKVELYLNDGTGNFESKGIIYDFGSMSWGLASADFDDDGDIDFIVSAHEKENRSKGHLYMKKNMLVESNHSNCFLSSKGEIIANVSFVPGIASLSPIDYENDGDIDIIVSTSIILYILVNEDNTFRALDIGYCKKTESPTAIDAQPMYRVGIACADFNDNGFTDFCLGSSDGYLRLFLNNQTYQ